MGLGLAFRCFFQVLGNRDFAERVEQLLQPQIAPDPEEKKKKLAAEQIRLLGILQRDGRLLDFLSEDLTAYSDDQIGAAVRDIHRDCKQTLEKYVQLVPIIDKDEESTVDVPAGYDPAAIRVTGNVSGQPPYKGILAHRGWKARAVNLPETTGSGDGAVLAPAEVEIE